MKLLHFFLILSVFSFFISCSRGRKLEEKGFQVVVSNEENRVEGIDNDSLKFETRPGSVLLTNNSNIRLTTVFKVNFDKRNKTTFIGSNDFHYNYSDHAHTNGNNWNYNFMPGIEAVYGYNMVNISHYNIKENTQKTLFEKPVLIKTLYYPAYSKDTLNHQPVSRDFFMVSVYNEDTDKDGFINMKDLRRLYLFDIEGNNKTPLVPENYSVLKSEYDSQNDFMYIFAQLDENKNGRRDEGEQIHIFWVD
ncbi:hypothetical protein LJC11_05060 [Bacteroidales bacterium OttesenSCG-928-I21]|nr:hypothetical protein [Bacteroidales bacterium OttesenSCG-928-I21]